MNARDFCFWLQRYFELQGVDPLNDGIKPAQAKSIRDHLSLVFAHDIDPSMGPKEHQAKLDNIHGPDTHHKDPDKRPRC